MPAQNSCESNPLIRLGDASKAPILDYSIPQKSCLPLYSAMPVYFPKEYFKKEYFEQVIDEFWENLKDKSVINIKRLILQELKSGTKSEFFENFHLIAQSSVPIVIIDEIADKEIPSTVYNDSRGVTTKVLSVRGDISAIKYENVNTSTAEYSPQMMTRVLDKENLELHTAEMKPMTAVRLPSRLAIEIHVNDLAEKFAKGYKAVCVGRADGRFNLSFKERKIKKLFPFFYVKMEMQQCSYLGDYGAGDTVNTFSLLPGEKTTIAINTYRNSVMANSRAQHILDSVSESSVNSFEKELQSQDGTQTDTTTNASTTEPGKVTTNGTGLIPALFWNHKKTVTEPTKTSNSVSHVNTIKTKIENSLSKSVSQSNHFRDVSVSSSSSSEVQEGESKDIVREIENVNLSRTLNFVFRRLVQKHTVVLWLKDVKFGFGNGLFTDDVLSHRLQDLVEQYVNPKFVNEVMTNLLRQVSHVYNYEHKPVQFIECKEIEMPQIKCECSDVTIPKETHCFWRKKEGLEDKYEDIKVPGVILSVNEYVMRTPSVIVDALLGQGEALDCYNINLQQQNVLSQEINNERMKQAIKIIDGFSTPEDQAKNYKLVFGDCCPEKEE